MNNTQTKHTDLSFHLSCPKQRDMAHLNNLGLRVSTSAPSLLSVSGSGCRYYAKQQKWMAKWTCEIMGMPENVEMEAVATDAPQLTATADAMDSCHRLPKRSHEWHMLTSKTVSAMTRQPEPSTKIMHISCSSLKFTFTKSRPMPHG